MPKVKKAEDLTHEPDPVDAVIEREQVSFRGFGAQVQATSDGAASRRRDSVTARVGTTLIVLLNTVALLAAFSTPTAIAHLAGASTRVALTAGICGVAIVGVQILHSYSTMRRRPRRGTS